MTYAHRPGINDADAHLMETPLWLAQYATAEVAAGLRPLDLGDGDYAQQAKLISGALGAAPATTDDLMRRKGWEAMGATDGRERSRALDELGFDSQLVFPTFAMTQLRGTPPDILYGGASALNKAMTDFCRHDPRLLAVGLVPLDDPDRAVSLALEAIDAGCAGILVPSHPPAGRSPSSLDLMEFWTTLAEADVPFMLHVDGTDKIIDPALHRTGRPAGIDMFGGGEHLKALDYMGIHVLPEMFLSAMILDGVFEELPALRCGVIELGAMWVVPWMRRLDMAQDLFGKGNPSLRALPLRPSQYVRRQIRFTPFPTEPTNWLIEQAGDDLFMFSTDYPHLEGGRDPIGRFEASLDGVDDRGRQRFYTDNFTTLMGSKLVGGTLR